MTDAHLLDPRPVTPLRAPFDVDVVLPGSKSITNRALMCAALADGRSVLTGALEADDTEAMIECLRALGIAVHQDGTTITIDGCGGVVPHGPATVNVRQSGTTARFISALCALGSGTYVVDADPQMRERPMGPTFDALRQVGVEVRELGEPGCLPAQITANGRLRGGEISLPGHVSSQFLSGLLMAAPCMTEGLHITLTSELVSRSYVEMTLGVMEQFGLSAALLRESTVEVEPDGYRAADVFIEPDASAASYPMAAAAMTGSTVRIAGLGSRSLQGDVGFAKVLAAMGADVTIADSSITVRGTGGLNAIDPHMEPISDTVPTFAVVAALADGPCTVRGIEFIRRKETDRIAAVVSELRRVGVRVDEYPDGFTVHPNQAHPNQAHPGNIAPAIIETYRDHRIAMSFALVGLIAPGIEIADPTCVTKTFPGYWHMLDTFSADR
jgi:3-phosphoshikimate 1-carboxyvinyltransferase